MIKKLTSRKFVLSALVAIGGAATALSGVGGTVGLVAGIAAATVTVITYVYTEGKIDEASVALSVSALKQILALIEEAKKDDK